MKERRIGKAMGRGVLICMLTVVCGEACATTYRFASLKASVAVGDYTYRFVRRGRVKDFVLEADFKAAGAGTALRVAFGYQDERNHYYAEASDTGCILVKVEDGIEKRVGTPPGGALARHAAGKLTLVRWRHTMGLWLDGKQVVEAYDGTYRSGRVALGPREELVAIDTVRFQVTGDVRLTDDFMRTNAEQTAWQHHAGSWRLKSLPNAGMSAKAFMLAGKAATGQALATRGHWFWHSYSVSAACKPLDDEAVGLAFYVRSPTRYHLLRCVPLGGSGRVELVRVADGQRQVLGTARAALAKGQWYRLEARVLGRRATACVDGHPLVDVVDPQLVCGSIGLWCEGAAGALFDDVTVAAPRGFAEDFERETAGKWLELGGTWRQHRGRLDAKPGEGLCLVASASGEGRYVSGEEGWSNYTVAADVLPPARGDVGLVACYQDEANHYLLALSPDAAALVRVAEGERTELARSPLRLPLAVVQRAELSVRDGVLTARLNGRTVARRCDDTLDHGRAGLYVRAVRGAGFDNVTVTTPSRAMPIFSTHEVFSAEASMENWAVRQSDWHKTTEAVAGRTQAVRWHRADFPGDVELEAKIDRLPWDGRLCLALAGDGAGLASGYLVSLWRGSERYRVTVERQGKELAKRSLALAREPKLFAAERVGHALLAHVDGKVVLTAEDAEPLDGRSVGWAASQARLETSGVNIYSRHVAVYAFHKAPTHWRTVAGDWEVTNRWACDPRWSFFAGERARDKLVAMWNKRDFGPDVTVEFAAGIRHDPDRGGSKYAYASDANVVLCGDGRDLRNGYNVVFGGWDNTRTRILRNGKTLAETRSVRFPRQYSIHRKWFYFKIQTQGGRLRSWVDNALALEATDPEPLTGGKVALWTWDNDIMVARVRISAPGDAPCELPAGAPPAQPPCIYR